MTYSPASALSIPYTRRLSARGDSRFGIRKAANVVKPAGQIAVIDACSETISRKSRPVTVINIALPTAASSILYQLSQLLRDVISSNSPPVGPISPVSCPVSLMPYIPGSISFVLFLLSHVSCAMSSVLSPMPYALCLLGHIWCPFPLRCEPCPIYFPIHLLCYVLRTKPNVSYLMPFV